MVEKTMEIGEDKVGIRVHATRNVILRFDSPHIPDSSFMWGFDGIEQWDKYLVMLNAFDRELRREQGRPAAKGRSSRKK